MVDAQLVGQIVAAGVTAVASGGAAFLGVRTANRTTKVEDERAKDTADWERIQRLVTMACSTNDKEAYVGLYHLQKSKDDWNDNPEQRAFIKRTCEALNASAVTAYHGGATQVTTTPPPGGTVSPP